MAMIERLSIFKLLVIIGPLLIVSKQDIQNLCCSQTSYLTWGSVATNHSVYSWKNCLTAGRNPYIQDNLNVVNDCSTCLAYQCIDWSVGSIGMQQREEQLKARTGLDVYLGVGYHGNNKSHAGLCYRITSPSFSKDLIVQAINQGGNVANGNFGLQTGGGGIGGFNACTEPETPISQFDGAVSQWGAMYTGWTSPEQCGNLPRYPHCSADPNKDDMQDLCRSSFTLGFRVIGGGSPIISHMCQVTCPDELWQATGLHRKDEASPNPTLSCNATREAIWSGGSLTSYMDCSKPSFAWTGNVNGPTYPGYEQVIPCRRDGYTRVNTISTAPTLSPPSNPMTSSTWVRTETPSSTTKPLAHPTSPTTISIETPSHLPSTFPSSIPAALSSLIPSTNPSLIPTLKSLNPRMLPIFSPTVGPTSATPTYSAADFLCCEETSYLTWQSAATSGKLYNSQSCLTAGRNSNVGDMLNLATDCSTCLAYQCIDWSVGSIGMQQREEQLKARTGLDVYLGVGYHGNNKSHAGLCYRITSPSFSKDLIVQAINQGGNVANGNFGLQTGGGGIGGFNACTEPETPISQFDGAVSQWGATYKGWTSPEQCGNLPRYPHCSADPNKDDMQDLCRSSFTLGFRIVGGGEPLISHMCQVTCPDELWQATGLHRKDEASPNPTLSCDAAREAIWSGGSLTSYMDCSKPSFAWTGNVNGPTYPGYEQVIPCRRDGYTRVNAMPTAPSTRPTQTPTTYPSVSPSSAPTNGPTYAPTNHPTLKPTSAPTNEPTISPTNHPTFVPTSPTNVPSLQPSWNPTKLPSFCPSLLPTNLPTLPTTFPTTNPTSKPTKSPTFYPTLNPSEKPTHVPSTPTIMPTYKPTYAPSAFDLMCCEQTSYENTNWKYCLNAGRGVGTPDKLNEVVSCETCLAYQCIDWTAGSAAMQRREKKFKARTGEDIYFGVGSYGNNHTRAGLCYRVSSDHFEKDLIVQVINGGSDIPDGNFDLQTGGGGSGLFNACSNPPTTVAQFNGTVEMWGRTYGGWATPDGCEQLPAHPRCNPTAAEDDLRELCQWSFYSGLRVIGGSNPTISSMCPVSCPEELWQATGLRRIDDSVLNPNTFCNASQTITGAGGSMTSMMDCSKPGYAWPDNVKGPTYPGYEQVIPCRRDGYTRINKMPVPPSPEPTYCPSVIPSVIPSRIPIPSPSASPTNVSSAENTKIKAPSSSPTITSTVGSIKIEGYGMVYVVQTQACDTVFNPYSLNEAYGHKPCNVSVSNNGYTISGGGRVYLAKKNVGVGQGHFDMYAQISLLGKTFSYTVDMSNVACGCNAGAYFVKMPGIDSYGRYNLSTGNDYYCDANQIQGTFCPEYDLIEGNKFTMATTLHSCTPSTTVPGYFPTCDKGGCATNVYSVNSNYMCPFSTCVIDTRRPFNVSHSHSKSVAGVLKSLTVTLSQGEKTAAYSICGKAAIFDAMSSVLSGTMVFASSLWGGISRLYPMGNQGIPNGMSWLDGVTGCTEQCVLEYNSVKFSNFILLDQ